MKATTYGVSIRRDSDDLFFRVFATSDSDEAYRVQEAIAQSFDHLGLPYEVAHMTYERPNASAEVVR